jgi:hypothetical protein
MKKQGFQEVVNKKSPIKKFQERPTTIIADFTYNCSVVDGRNNWGLRVGTVTVIYIKDYLSQS